MTDNNKFYFYVVMTDKSIALGTRIKKLVFKCDTESEAETVKSHALYNRQMGNVNIRKLKSLPTFNAEIYDVEYHNRDNSRNWYR
jgi:hypothetical protein